MSEKLHEGLPVSGYVPQSQHKIDLVNQNKQIEEQVLRQIDTHYELVSELGIDPRMVAIARTQLQGAFMWLNRSVFQPTRIELLEDTQ